MWWKNVEPVKMTKQEWDSTHSDYKSIKPDETKTVLRLGERGTTIFPVEIVQYKQPPQLSRTDYNK